MEDNLDNPKDAVQENPHAPSSLTVLSENLSKKYPYLTAYVGFLALYLLAGFAAGLIFIIPQGMIVGRYSPYTESFTRVLQLIFGFYVFRHVVNKHILPYNNK